MSNRQVMMIVGVTVLALVASTGCVSKKMYRQQVDETDQRIAGVESGVETNERRIDELSSETDSKIADLQNQTQKAVEVGNSAMNKANTAEQTAQKAMRGKLIWQETLSDDRVKFSFDGAALPDEAKSALDSLASKVKSMDKAVYLEIEGHTDNIGSAEYNYTLGEKRATAVQRYLNEQGGIPLHAMNVISYGEDKPVADNGSPEGRAKNRRVVVKVLE